MAIVTPADVRVYFPQLATPSDDAAMEVHIAGVDDQIAAFVGFPETTTGIHTMTSASYEIFIDRPSPIESSVICVCVHPIASITSLHVDVLRVYGASTLLVLNTDYTFDSREGMIVLTPSSLFSFPTAFRGIKVALVAGYATTPPGLRAIACEAVAHAWLRRNDRGATSYSALGVSKSMSDPGLLLPAAVKDALRYGYMTPCGLARLMEAA